MQLDKLTLKSQEALQGAQNIAREHSHRQMDGEHLLLALLDKGGSSLKKIFQSAGLKRDAVLKALSELRDNQRVTDQNSEGDLQAQEKYWHERRIVLSMEWAHK